jgi:serine/threonine protein kinase
MGCITAKENGGEGDEHKIKNATGKMEGVSTHLTSQTFVKQAKGRLRDNYKIGKMLGQGGFGEVRLCRHNSTKE